MVDTDEGHTPVNYRGFLTEKAKQYTVKDLVTLGFSDKDMSRFARGVDGMALNTETPVRVKVVLEEYKGKVYPKVKGIYPAKSKTEATYEQLAEAGKIMVAAEVMAAQAEGGMKGSYAKKQAMVAEAGGNDHDLPF
jgi:hypothetical protein